MQGPFFQVFDDTDPLRSDCTLLAAALCTLGIRPRQPSEPVHVTTEFDRGAVQFRCVWTFAGESKDGRFIAAVMKDAWDDGAWLLKNPRHALAILRTGLTYARLAGFVPRFTLAQLAKVETPDTWLEAGVRNLVWCLRRIPDAAKARRSIIRFERTHAAFVPAHLGKPEAARLIHHAEHPGKRPVAA